MVEIDRLWLSGPRTQGKRARKSGWSDRLGVGGRLPFSGRVSIRWSTDRSW